MLNTIANDTIFVNATINPSNIVNNNITDLDSTYKSNNGLLINFLTYKSTSFNYYTKHYNDLNTLLFQLFNLPEIIIFKKIDITNQNIYSYMIEKSIFNNIPVINNNIETLFTLNTNNINKLIYKVIQKDSFGNFPSLIFPLLTDHIRLILESDIINWYITFKVPIIIPWGTLSPFIAYKKYLNSNNDISNSYIINFGPSYLDELSAYIQFIKSIKLYQKYNNNTQKFLKFQYNQSEIIGADFLFNYQPNKSYDSGSDYFVDLSNTYIFYLGIYNNYGWHDPFEFFKIYSRSLSAYIFNGDTSNFDICYNNISDNSNNIYNPNVVMINIPLFETIDDQNNLRFGKSVSKSFNLLNNIITTDLSQVDLSNINIFLRNYGKEGDLIALQTLYESSYNKYIPITCGGFYDFIEDNINTFTDPTIFNGLLTIKSSDIANINSITLLKNKMTYYANRLTDDIQSNYFSKLTFDQINFQSMLTDLLQIIITINNSQITNGIIDNSESHNITYKIYSGEDLFNSASSLDFNKLIKTHGGNAVGYLDNNFILSGLIGFSYNNGKYWDNNNGYPFNRNTSYTVFKRDYSYYDPITFESPKIDLSLNFNWSNFYRHFLFSTSLGNPIYFSSEINLINAIIFKINNDETNFNIYYQKYSQEINI